MNPDDPINGCIHGAAIDEKAKGLTKREYSAMMNQAAIIQGLYAMEQPPLTRFDFVAAEALRHTDALFKAIKAEHDAEAVVDLFPSRIPPLTPSEM